MLSTKRLLLLLVPVFALGLTACGESSDGDGDGGGETAGRSLSGTAAAGAAIIGTVTVKDADGNARSAQIEADGSYDVDVSGLVAPFRLRAQGTVGGRTYKLHSYAEDADVGGTVNITPFTDLIVANAAGQIAEAYFDDDVLDSTETLDPTELEAQEAALQSRLQDVFDVLGLDTAIDLLNSSFAADHSGLDAALDLIRIEVDTVSNVATITNLVDNTSVSDSIVDTEDNSDGFTVDPADEGNYTTQVSDTQQIVAVFDAIAALFAGGLPTENQFGAYLATDFLLHDQSRGEFLTDVTTDPTAIGLEFYSIVVSELDSTAGTATVDFVVGFDGEIDPERERWYAERNGSDWQLRGNQYIADVELLTFHCNDYDGTDANPGGCGINAFVWDEDFTNNGNGDQPIGAARWRLIDGADEVTVKETIYLGNPDYAGAGELQIYNSGNPGNYSGDWRGFGSAANEIDAAQFEVDDIVELSLYTADLDLTDPLNPVVSGAPLATYTVRVAHEPSLVELYPSATAATLSAIQGFAPGDSLTVAWTLTAGTLSDEVLLEISDGSGNRFEIWDESFTGDELSTSFSSTDLSQGALEGEGLDSNAVEYQLLVRIYAFDPLTGQAHSVDYRTSIPGPGAP